MITNEEIEILNQAGEIISKYAVIGGIPQSDLSRYENMVIAIIDGHGMKNDCKTHSNSEYAFSPIIYTGSGDDVVSLKSINKPHVYDIDGNASKNYFGVIAYNSSGERLGSLVNTTDVYHGIVFDCHQSVANLEIKSSDPWKIRVLPLSTMENASKGMTIKGSGDSVFVFDPSAGESNLAVITGNKGNDYFAVIGYDKNLSRISAFVNTVSAYEGKVMLRNNPRYYEIKAVGEWSITFK